MQTADIQPDEGGESSAAAAFAVAAAFIYGTRYKTAGQVTASLRVWQIKLSSLIFDKNIKNTPPTVWQKT